MSNGQKLSLGKLIKLLEISRKRVCLQILEDFSKEIKEFPGSIKKHQAWEGGYLDHITETMNIACLLYPILDSKRKLPFILSDALFVIFIHDIDKLLRYGIKKGRNDAGKNHDYYFKQVIIMLENTYHYKLNTAEENALKYVHGELKDYHPTEKVMKPLACFVHCCDIISARIWYDFGKEKINW